MHLHYFSLYRQTEFLNQQLSGATVGESFTQVKNEWNLVLELPDQSVVYLQLNSNPTYPFIILNDHLHRRKNSTDVMDEITGKSIKKFRILPGERVIFINTDDSNLRVAVQLFTNRANFFLLDAKDKILNSFKNRRQNEGQIFNLPPVSLVNPQEITKSDFERQLLAFPDRTLQKALKQNFLYMTATVADEILHRSELDGSIAVHQLDSADTYRLWENIREFLKQCREAPPRIYFQNELPVKFALGPLLHLAHLDFVEYENINTALRNFCFQSLRFHHILQKKTHFTRLAQQRLNILTKTSDNLRQQPAAAEKREHFQKIGQLLLAQPQAAVSENKVELVDYFDPNMPVITVKIDPSLSLQENASLYFERAKKTEEQQEKQITRRKNIQRQIEQLKEMLTRIDTAGNPVELEKIEHRLKSLRLLQPEEGEREQYRLPYKHFQHRNFDIWVGRSARDNDRLTFGAAHKEDWWLHVQGYAGSHVVVRNPERREHLPQDVLEYAARLAVTFSEAKHASYVPVIYTRVKYVRKPRKSPPGAVIPSQLKSIFVDPLPEGSF